MTPQPTGDPARAGLDARILSWMREPDWKPDDARFEALALELFAFQFERCAPYARFCRARGLTPERVAHWRSIPPVPTGAFKEVALRCFPPERTVRILRTSGTATARRGELHLDTLALYQASLLPTFERFVLPELGPSGRMRMRVLAPSPDEARDSSLSLMFGCVLEAHGDVGSGFDLEHGALRLEPLLASLEQARADAAPLALCGTAFAFVHLLDAMAERGIALRLPAGSRLMETGGLKGRARELSREQLNEAIEARLGVPPVRVIDQYGMTELASQFYDSVLARPGELRRKLGPPWARVRIVDPETGADAAPGDVGRIAVVDLANSGSVLAVQTADLGRALADGFELLGREAGAEARGCSLAVEAMLGGAPG